MASVGNMAADGSTQWVKVGVDSERVRVCAKGDFGGGTIALEQLLNGSTYSYLDSNQAAITYVDDFDVSLDLAMGDVIRITLSGSTSPDIDWMISE